MADTTAPQAADRVLERCRSTDLDHLREDLSAALDVVMALADAGLDARVEAARIVAQMDQTGPQDALRKVKEELGRTALGVVALFSIEGATSMAGHAEAVTHRQSLAAMGMSTADLGWPEDRLHPAYAGAGRAWTHFQAKTYDEALAAWRLAHPDPVATTTHTIIGCWSGGEVVITGIVDGEHPVWGGTDETGDGLFAESFAIPADAPDKEAALREALAAAHYEHEEASV